VAVVSAGFAVGDPDLRNETMRFQVESDVASLIRSLHERAQQAEATRDAAQAVASRAEERARKAEAERDEWKGVALEGARIVKQPFPAYASIERWAMAVPMGDEPDIDPAAGTADHEGEPGRNDEYACPQIIGLGEALKRSIVSPGRNGE
jgi:hypothetical protein